MKKKLCFLGAILNSFILFSQVPIIEWQKCYGGSNDDQAQIIQQTIDGGYIIANLATSNDGDVTNFHGGSGGDIWVVKVNNLGAIEWQKTLGGTNSEGTTTIKQTSDGNYIVCGYTVSNNGDVTNNHGGFDCWIVKLDNLGNILWQKTLGGSANDGFWSSLKQTSDGGFIVTCNTSSSDGDVTINHGGSDIWVIKLNSLGAIEWQKTYGGTDSENPRSIQQLEDGSYIVSGNTNSNDGDVSGNHGNSDGWVLKLNNNGDIQWQKTYGSSGFDYANSIIKTVDDGYIFSGLCSVNNGDVTGNHGGNDIWVVKLNNSGTIIWQKSLGGTGTEIGSDNCILQDTNGNYIIAGQTNSNNGDVTGNHGNFDAWIVKLSNTGVLLWQKPLGGSDDDRAYSVIQTVDQGFALAGLSKSLDGDVTGNHGNFDYWVVKLGPDNLNTTDFNDQSLVLYPNPAVNQLFISNSLLITDRVIIYDVDGKTIASKITNNSIDISQLQSGMYIIEFKDSSNKSIFKKIIKQ